MAKSVPIPFKPVSVEPASIPVPEGRSIAGKLIAVRRGRASHGGVTKAAEVSSPEAAPVPSAKAAAMHGGRSQSRAGRDKSSAGQRHRYFTNDDAHSVLLRDASQPLRRSAVAIAVARMAPLRDGAFMESAPQRSK
jgi:hypothetical protein